MEAVKRVLKDFFYGAIYVAAVLLAIAAFCGTMAGTIWFFNTYTTAATVLMVVLFLYLVGRCAREADELEAKRQEHIDLLEETARRLTDHHGKGTV